MESNIINKFKSQIKWIINQLLCLNLRTGNTDSINGANGSLLVTDEVKYISAYDQHLEFIDSPESISGIKGHTVIKIKDELVGVLNTNTFKNLLNSQEIKLGWKNGGIRYTKTPTENTVGVKTNIYTRNGFISNSNNLLDPNRLLNLQIQDINNLIVTIPKFSEIASYQPKLIIQRYKPTKKKGTKGFLGITDLRNHYSTAKFRQPGNNVNRPSVIALTASNQIIDIGQEHYFSVKGWNGTAYNLVSNVYARGIGKRSSNKYLKAPVSFYNARVYLEFRLQITKDAIVYTSSPLNKIKMIASLNINQTLNTLVKSKIKFKFT